MNRRVAGCNRCFSTASRQRGRVLALANGRALAGWQPRNGRLGSLRYAAAAPVHGPNARPKGGGFPRTSRKGNSVSASRPATCSTKSARWTDSPYRIQALSLLLLALVVSRRAFLDLLAFLEFAADCFNPSGYDLLPLDQAFNDFHVSVVADSQFDGNHFRAVTVQAEDHFDRLGSLAGLFAAARLRTSGAGDGRGIGGCRAR